MKFIGVSDLHLTATNPKARKDSLPETQFKKFDFILDVAKKYDANILQAGDFFNAARSWMLLPEVIEILKSSGVNIYGVFGQHDTYMYAESTRHRTNLGVLEKAGLVNILNNGLKNQVEFDGGKVVVNGASFGQNLPVVEKQKGIFRIGVIHAPIAEEPIYPKHKYWDAKQFLLRNDGYDFILCADIHRSFRYSLGDRIIVNTGPILRKEATEYNFKHQPHVYFFDTNDLTSMEKIMVPCDDGEMVLDRSHIDNANENANMMDSFIESIKNEDSVSFGVSFEQNLLNYYEQNGIDNSVKNIIAETMEEKG